MLQNFIVESSNCDLIPSRYNLLNHHFHCDLLRKQHKSYHKVSVIDLVSSPPLNVSDT